MTITEREVINSLHVSDVDSALNVINSAFDLSLSASVTNRIDHEGDVPTQIFVVDLFRDHSTLPYGTNVDAFLMRDAFTGGFPSAQLIERIPADQETALTDPRWETNLMRLVPLWIAVEGSDHEAAGEHYLEIYDAPVPRED